MQGSAGNWLIVAGIALALVGLLLKTGALGWLGQLPGDIHIKRENFQVYFPLTSMIVISILLTLIATIARKFF